MFSRLDYQPLFGKGENLKGGNRAVSLITDNTFPHCRVGFSWTTSLETAVDRIYYPKARRHKFDFRVVKTIFYERAQRAKYLTLVLTPVAIRVALVRKKMFLRF